MLTAFICCLCEAQDNQTPPIATDRPGYSDGSNVVAPGRLQIETGFFRTQVGSETTSSIGDLLVRAGVSQMVELRLIGLSYGFSPTSNQLLDPSIGFKYRLRRDEKAEVTLIGQSTFPIGSGDLRANEWNPTLKIAWTTPRGSDTLGGNFVSTRLGSGASRFDQFVTTLFYSKPVTSATSLTTEIWGIDRIAPGQPAAGFASVAITHLLDNDRQLDFRIGSGFNASRDGWFIQGGFSIRF